MPAIVLASPINDHTDLERHALQIVSVSSSRHTPRARKAQPRKRNWQAVLADKVHEDAGNMWTCSFEPVQPFVDIGQSAQQLGLFYDALQDFANVAKASNEPLAHSFELSSEAGELGLRFDSLDDDYEIGWDMVTAFLSWVVSIDLFS